MQACSTWWRASRAAAFLDDDALLVVLLELQAKRTVLAVCPYGSLGMSLEFDPVDMIQLRSTYRSLSTSRSASSTPLAFSQSQPADVPAAEFLFQT